MRVKKIEQTFPDNSRVIVMGDIHTNIQLFLKMLDTLAYQPDEDFLIINGDILEKGHQNIEILSYMRNMLEKTERMTILEGNCEIYIRKGGNIIPYLQQRGNSIIGEWLEEQGVDIYDQALTEDKIYEVLGKHYSEELQWLDELPTAIVTPDYVFVHAAAGRGNLDEALSDCRYITTKREYLYETHDLEQQVVVGHYPVVNYCRENPANYNAVQDKEKKIIALDGSNQLDVAGQLNALVITYTKGVPTEAFYSVDNFLEKKVIQSFSKENSFIRNVFWPYGFEKGTVLRKGKYFSLCQVNDMEEATYFKNEYLTFFPDNTYQIQQYHSGHLLSIEQGEIIKVIDDSTKGYIYVKQNGIAGWVPSDCVS